MKDLERIISLPERDPVTCTRLLDVATGKMEYPAITQALVEVTTERFVRRRTDPCKCRELGFHCITEFNAEQAWTLHELRKVGGVIGSIAVGGGKTLAGILAPLAVPGVRRAVLLAKSDQRLHYRRMWRQVSEHFRVPSFVIDDGGEPMLGTNDWPVLHFVPYSKLSRPESTRLLNDLNPDLVIADEMHALFSWRSARTLRFLRFMSSRQGLKFCGWSGTFIDKTLRSVAHLIAHALGYGSPMPVNPSDVEAFASVLDPSPQPDRHSSTAQAIFRAFGDPAFDPGMDFVGLGISRVREGFQRRLMRTPGVVASRSTSSSASITIRERKVEMPQSVREALKKARGWTRPDGEELVDAMEQARTARECASGYFYYWKFRDEPRELIEEWFDRRQAFNRELRDKILKGEEYLDSRLLCENAAERACREPPYDGPLPVWKAWCWPAWRDIRDQVEHEQCVRWIDDYLARDAAEWGREHRGIIWCLSTAFAQRVSQLSGLPYHGGGPGAEARILAERGDRSIIASIKAHSEGRDGLQRLFHTQLVAEVPAGGKAWGQLLGRLCRQGQEADEIDTYVYAHYQEARDAIRRAVAQAEFVQDIAAAESLLLAADFSFEL